MEFKRPQVQGYEILSVDEFKKRKNLEGTSNATLSYAFETDRLDFVRIGSFRFVVFNSKAINFEIEARRPRKAKNKKNSGS